MTAAPLLSLSATSIYAGHKVLVANRGEIACRVFRTLRELQIPSVAIYSDVDAGALHVRSADESIGLGDVRCYLDGEKIIAAAKDIGATAIHPGYGFLAENAEFTARCAAAGLIFIGPDAEAIIAFGDKRKAREVAESVGVPVIPGAQVCDSVEDAKHLATEIGYPLLLKAAAGGGGKGMRRVNKLEEIAEAFLGAQSEGQNAFGDGRLLLEKYIYPSRHIEVQIVADGDKVVAVGDRECSLQRRYQKVIEEAPAVSISEKTRQDLYASAENLLSKVSYKGVATVEFLVVEAGSYYFLEVNTRLQVEHPVTELTSGMDLVAEQLTVAFGGSAPDRPEVRGHAIEARLNAEDAYAGYLPQSGVADVLLFPHWPGVRVDTGIESGGEVSPHYDSMIAKVIAWAPTRQEAAAKLRVALQESVVLGLVTNQGFLLDVLSRAFFIEGKTFTTTLAENSFEQEEAEQWMKDFAEEHLQNIGSGKSASELSAADILWSGKEPSLRAFRM